MLQNGGAQLVGQAARLINRFREQMLDILQNRPVKAFPSPLKLHPGADQKLLKTVVQNFRNFLALPFFSLDQFHRQGMKLPGPGLGQFGALGDLLLKGRVQLPQGVFHLLSFGDIDADPDLPGVGNADISPAGLPDAAVFTDHADFFESRLQRMHVFHDLPAISRVRIYQIQNSFFLHIRFCPAGNLIEGSVEMNHLERRIVYREHDGNGLKNGVEQFHLYREKVILILHKSCTQDENY